MSLQVIAERTFVGADQERFAAFCGDRNPLHMDAVAARRTMAGFPTVHGIHALLWGLDSLFRYLPTGPRVRGIKVIFEKMIFVGDRVRTVLVKADDQHLRVDLMVGSDTMLRLDVALGDSHLSDNAIYNGSLFQPTEPLVPTFEEMSRCHGRVPLSPTSEKGNLMFPAAAGVLGEQRVAGLACSSYLVGMVCPGLHSIYRCLNLSTTPSSKDDQSLHFQVVQSDSRFRLLWMDISGGGWVGSLEVNARPQPTAQADLATIADRIRPGEFRGGSALVIGGSRGLGELVAKIAAAGGANVTLTYSVGEMDARRVQAEIADFGGKCKIIHYDVRKNAKEQLSNLPTILNQIYYLATPAIFRQSKDIFIKQHFENFLIFYIYGFYDLCKELQSKWGNKLSFFYPSSVYIDDRPRSMTEYTMAKAASEILCADLQRSARILVRRLPRLPTDQTAALLAMEMANPIDIMLPIVREVHANRIDDPAGGET